LEDDVELINHGKPCGEVLYPTFYWDFRSHRIILTLKGLGYLAEIKTEIGHAVGINIGRRWRNFEAEFTMVM
jgi:hypothetical protein